MSTNKSPNIISEVNPVGEQTPQQDVKFKSIFTAPRKFDPPHLDIEVESGIYWSGRCFPCDVCGERTEFITYLPESAHVCSRKCFSKINI
jgi:hypothetical protein